MGDQLLPFPLTERSVHLCVDMQRIFSAEGPWPTPWMDRVLPVAAVYRHDDDAAAEVNRIQNPPATVIDKQGILPSPNPS
jgi:hypothetical protein